MKKILKLLRETASVHISGHFWNVEFCTITVPSDLTKYAQCAHGVHFVVKSALKRVYFRGFAFRIHCPVRNIYHLKLHINLCLKNNPHEGSSESVAECKSKEKQRWTMSCSLLLSSKCSMCIIIYLDPPVLRK